MMVINNKYEFGDTVYLITDPEQHPRLVVAFVIYKQGEIMYKIVAGTTESSHYDFELSDTKNILIDAV